jgi:hypothetical protein
MKLETENLGMSKFFKYAIKSYLKNLNCCGMPWNFLQHIEQLHIQGTKTLSPSFYYHYLGVILDEPLPWSSHINQVRKETAERLGMLNRKCDLSVRNGVLLYKQLIRPMMNYSWPAWRSAARNSVRRLQVLQFNCLRLPTVAPWYVTNSQIREDLGVPLFADHIRALTATFDSKLADVWNPLLRQLSGYRGLTPSHAKAKVGRGRQAIRRHHPRWPILLNEPRFSVVFPNCNANARV